MRTRIVLAVFWGLIMITIVSLSRNFYLEKFISFEHLLGLAFSALKISLFANFWVFKLSANDGLFGFIRAFLYVLTDRYVYKDCQPNAERKQAMDDLLKPIITCEICVGTNICVWVYAYLSRSEFILMDFLFLISATGLITLLTSKTWLRITTN